MLKQSQNLKQTLKHLPSIILNQKILTIPTLALDNIIKKEIELNPMLEEIVDSDIEESESMDVIKGDVPETSSEIKSDSTDESFEDVKTDDDLSPESKVKEEYDWDEYFENETESYKTYDNEYSGNYENSFIDEDNSMNSGLLLQLNLSDLSKKLIFVAEEIIWSLTPDGYFTDKYEDVLEDLNVKKIDTEFENEIFTTDDINEALKFIQYKIDPPGIGAGSLKECLLIQTERSDKPTYIKQLAGSVIENQFEDLRLKRYENVSRELKIELSLVKEVFEFIHKLNPKPGFIDNTGNQNYIVPDLIVKKIEDKYEIFLNEKFTPSLRINRTYQNLYSNKKSELDKNTKEYLVSNFNRAKWFIDAINSRKETMLKVMNAIISYQKDFFDNNGEGLKPLYEKTIAEDIRMDSSTISRTVRGKYVQTDFGIYELRSFFTTPLHTTGINEISNVEVKAELKKLIDNENKKKPLTDEELAAELNKAGFRIARRTVAKYREAINLPVAKLRREII
ncbi:MAG TPA: RNA polymerase factor sigma-54 [Ignavibacteria bacterium]|nr:RNA polymerase factor sigma-54 [Ignavibacteria bacterium]